MAVPYQVQNLQLYGWDKAQPPSVRRVLGGVDEYLRTRGCGQRAVETVDDVHLLTQIPLEGVLVPDRPSARPGTCCGPRVPVGR